MLPIKEVILFPLLRPSNMPPFKESEEQAKRRMEYIDWIKAGKPEVTEGAKAKKLKKICQKLNS